MKKLLFSLATAGTLLLSGCDRKAETTTASDATRASETASPVDNTAVATPADDHAATGGDHAAMTGDHAATDGGMMAAMAQMMQKMHKAPMHGNVDYDFVSQMTAHHQGAVAMAEIELAKGKDATLRTMADKIKSAQKLEIADLNGDETRLDDAPANYRKDDPADPFQLKMKAAMDLMMQGMGAESGDVDADFAAMMIPHHQSAVAMVDAYLAHGKDAKLKKMAGMMKAAQLKEIKQMQDWQAKNGGAKAANAAYICPMKCEGSASDKPGKCPVCGMDLVKNT